jgi:hypothetical protein
VSIAHLLPSSYASLEWNIKLYISISNNFSHGLSKQYSKKVEKILYLTEEEHYPLQKLTNKSKGQQISSLLPIN